MNKLEQREISVGVYASCGWLEGTVHLTRNQSFLDYLDRLGPFMSMSNVSVPGIPGKVPWFALRKDAIGVVIPECNENNLELHHPTGTYVRRRLSFLLEHLSLEGSVGMLETVKLPDYVAHHRGFHLVRNSIAHGKEQRRTLPIVFVNSDRVVAISELQVGLTRAA